ncbi:MAG: NAD-dependent epimerase/dehydratase family protein [Pirellulales bacterium]|nr:NAD-dependent epimerase/dehydratase family protein [Pirellulales bacterium]
MHTLVTGGTGLVGNNCVRLLLERGHQVRVLARVSSDARPFAGLDVEIAPGDVRDASSLQAATQDIDWVVHAAAVVQLGWTGLDLQQAINVEGTRNVARAARAAGARMVHVSSVDALGIGTRTQPANEESPVGGHVEVPYVVTKRAAEQALLEEVAQGLDAVIVNPVYVLGPWDWKPSSGRMILAVAKGQSWIAPPGGNDFCDVRNVARAVLTALERGQTGRRYILGGPAMSYFEAWTLFAEVTGGRRPILTARPRWLRAAGLLGSAWGRISGREPDVNSASTAMSALEHHYRCDRAVAELDYNPGDVREAATAAWQWFRQHGYA